MSEQEATYEEVVAAAQTLLAALDSRYGGPPLSLRAENARQELRRIVGYMRDPANKVVTA